MGRHYYNFQGQQFGAWTVIGPMRHNKPKPSEWFCRCVCGVERFVVTASLSTGRSSSCGCIADKKSGKRFTTHGKSKHRIYNIWKGIKGRCLNPNNPHFHQYGGRGISIHQEWVHDFQAFFTYIQENLGIKNKSIDRRDTNLGYIPGNLRWANQQQQCWNTRTRSKQGQFKGVRLRQDKKKFEARITCKYKTYHLGAFDTALEAAEAYNKAAGKLFGEYAFLNKI